MRFASVSLFILCALVAAAPRPSATQTNARARRVVIATGTLLDDNPLKDIDAVNRVVFVMKGGVVYRNDVCGRV